MVVVATEMGFPSGLTKLILALTFTAVGVQGQCEQSEVTQLGICIYPYINKFSALSDGFCNKERISKDICNDFEKIAECVIKNKISPACLEDGEFEQLKKFGFFCTLTDFKERCPNVPIVKTGDLVQTTKSTPEGQTNDASGAAVTCTSLGLLLVLAILLLFIFMQTV